uniref:Heat shock protein 19.8 n=1 Tax=Oxya chinensis TaxID=165482 RepID=A0A0C5I3G3_9ORTH|nr:heat shock protein 19.8 [Oxya chinensis]
MLRSFGKAMPAAAAVRHALRQPSQCRSFWDFTRSSDLRSLARDMERQVERLEKDIMGSFPFNRMRPRYLPISGTSTSPNTFRYDIDVEGFKPEEIQVSLKDRVLTLSAKMDRTSEDGSRFYQEIVRQVTIPEKVKIEELKSYIHDGVLSVEAPRESEGGPKEIPVSREEQTK